MPEGSYLDTSFLLKPYVFEAESEDISNWIRERYGRLYVSPLSDVEVATSLHRTFESSVVAMRTVDDYRQDCTLGLYQKLPMDNDVFVQAEMIAERYAAKYKLRSLDILHLATALRHGVTSIGTFDRRMAQAAEVLGLTLVVPERS